jgi:hypothetical protein
MVVVARSLRLVSVGMGVGVPRWDGGGGVDVGVAVDGISGGTAGSSSGEASLRVHSSGVSGRGSSDGGVAVDGGVAGISGGAAGSSNGEASSRVSSSGVSGRGTD